MVFFMKAARQKDRPALCQLLPTLIHCENDRAYEDTFLHSIISYLIPFGEDFSNEDFCTVVFDDFLLVSCYHYQWTDKGITVKLRLLSH